MFIFFLILCILCEISNLFLLKETKLLKLIGAPLYLYTQPVYKNIFMFLSGILNIVYLIFCLFLVVSNLPLQFIIGAIILAIGIFNSFNKIPLKYYNTYTIINTIICIILLCLLF